MFGKLYPIADARGEQESDVGTMERKFVFKKETEGNLHGQQKEANSGVGLIPQRSRQMGLHILS